MTAAADYRPYTHTRMSLQLRKQAEIKNKLPSKPFNSTTRKHIDLTDHTDFDIIDRCKT
jgi:hypothetical protein